MTERPVLTGDPESGQPNLPRTDSMVAEVATESPPRAPTSALVASGLLPGLGHFLTGAPIRGMLLLFAWGVLLGSAYLARQRLASIGSTAV